MRIDSAPALGRHAKVTSDVYTDFPADDNSAPDLAILREDARKEGERYGFEDVLLISEVVPTSSTRKDHDAARRFEAAFAAGDNHHVPP
ncbi:hypothetical protein QQY24_14655 [Streptomyces sp. TG1A-8]|uniref:hypothetical protein n=1 Tax=Streptomyces sp. TG1A-8 TaxID=3051385 RepID=UPI00265C393C|nr:hypothetical protein [Streptomyces sp. TG1A-8]MDO0926592.1 hypothetical protein [Streptomyces sp. TG1A-8]